MSANDGEYSVWQALRSSESHLPLRIGASVATAALGVGLGILGAWILAFWGQWWSGIDEFTAAGTLGGILFWLLAMRRIWRPVGSRLALVRPICATTVLIVVVSFASVAANAYLRYDEVVIAGLLLCATAGAVFIWMPAWLRLVQGRPILRRDDQVDVTCPKCGYALIGLSELRCPECGERFTIDGLFRAQHYTRRRPRFHASTPDPDPEQHREPDISISS